MVRRLTPTSSHAFMIEIVFRSTWVFASVKLYRREQDWGLGIWDLAQIPQISPNRDFRAPNPLDTLARWCQYVGAALNA